VRVCIQRLNRSWNCSTRRLRPGKTKRHFACRSSGRHRLQANDPRDPRSCFRFY
jgi:hypothetical protein